MQERVFVTGGSGLVGSSLTNLLKNSNYDVFSPTSSECNLLVQSQVREMVSTIKPNIAILIAAKVGGIKGNMTFPGTFSIENTLMQHILISELVKIKVKKIIFIGSSCIYPKEASIPLTPSSLFSGDLEPTNKWYAMSKLATIQTLNGIKAEFGIKTITLLPTNLYGPRDNFDLDHGHLIPSLLLKFKLAKDSNKRSVEVWGTGKARRELLFVDDFSKAILTLLAYNGENEIFNVGSGEEYSIEEIANKISSHVGFKGEILFNPQLPEGIKKKSLDSTAILDLGWRPKFDLDEGLKITKNWLENNLNNLRGFKVT
jgi:GDP-L-fucose synthase